MPSAVAFDLTIFPFEKELVKHFLMSRTYFKAILHMDKPLEWWVILKKEDIFVSSAFKDLKYLSHFVKES